MEIGIMVVLYFLLVIIAILALVIVHDKQILHKILSEHVFQQEKITELKLENRRLEHTIKMQDESIVHLINDHNAFEGKFNSPEETLRETMMEW